MSPSTDDMLDTRQTGTYRNDTVYVAGGIVPRVTTVPVDAGVESVVRFADKCWQANLSMQQAAMAADRKLALVEQALLSLIERGLDKDVAVALAAVQTARGLL